MKATKKKAKLTEPPRAKVVVDNDDAYKNICDALDLIKAVQVCKAPNSLHERRDLSKPGVIMPVEFWKALAEARAALDVCAQMMERSRGKPTQDEILYAKNQIINSTWYLGYKVVDGAQIEVVLHDRDPWKVDAKTPETEREYRLDEDDDRTVHGAWIDGKKYAVVNPKHVFEYGEFES